MKIRVGGYSATHTLYLRTCPVCGRKFIKYSKAKLCCSEGCEKKYREEYDKERWRKIKVSPTLRYNHRKATIEKREQERKAKIRHDLPNIKRALKQGDEALVDYIFNHYGSLGKLRKYHKT